MIAPRLYIFGVPDGFDMLDGSRQEISYFQRFYDGSPEDTKFTVHRDSNGTVTYTFLKYNLSSGKSRTGSFFGMSLAFSGCHCIYPLTLYILFDYVYQNHVLCDVSNPNNGILKSIANSEVKAQYLITRFEDCREHVKFIEKVFMHNLATNDVLATSFYPLDPSFKNENQNLVVNLPLVEGLTDDTLLNSFREYSYVTISPNWKPVLGTEENTELKDIVKLAPQQVKQWKDLIPTYQRYIIQGLGNLDFTDKDEVRKYQKQTEETLNQLRKYSYNKNIAPSLQANYEELRDQLEDLYQRVVDAQNGGRDKLPPDSIPPTPQPTPSFWDNVKEWISNNKGKVAIISGAAVLVVLLVLFRPKQAPAPEQYCCATDVRQCFDSQIKNEEFEKIILDSISDKKLVNELKNELGLAITRQTNRIDTLVNEAKRKEDWVTAFVLSDQYFDTVKKNDKAEELRIEFDEYIVRKIDGLTGLTNSICTQRANQLLALLTSLNEKHYIDETKINKYNQRIKKIIQPVPKPTVDKYEVEFWQADSKYNPIILLSNSSNNELSLNVTTKDNYLIKVKKNNRYLTKAELNKIVDFNDKDTFDCKNEGIGLFWKSKNASEQIIVNSKITITIQLQQQ